VEKSREQTHKDRSFHLTLVRGFGYTIDDQVQSKPSTIEQGAIMSVEITLTSANFQKEVLESAIPVLVDFWAEWCMPCRMIAPSIAQIAQAYEGKVKVGKVNVDDEGDIASQYGIISIPTLLYFKDGQMIKQKVGALPKHEIENFIKA
jgi:thioredoxin 1